MKSWLPCAKGSMLRQEEVALDDRQPGPAASSPSRTSPSKLLQPRADNLHSVFFNHRAKPRRYYERNLSAASHAHVGGGFKQRLVCCDWLRPRNRTRVCPEGGEVRRADLLAICTRAPLPIRST